MHEPLKTLLGEKDGTLYTVTPETTVLEAARTMSDVRIGSLLVIENDQPVGIFTERDVMKRVVGLGKDPAATRVDDVMSREMACVSPSTTVGEAMKIITEKRFRHLPVVEDGRVLGMVSIGDLTSWMVRDQQQEIQLLVNYIAGNY